MSVARWTGVSCPPQTRRAACAGAATCWTSPSPCTASSSLPAISWTNSSLYILQHKGSRLEQDGIGSLAPPGADFASLSTATGNQSKAGSTVLPAAVSVKRNGHCVYSRCHRICLCSRCPSSWVILHTAITELFFSTSDQEKNICL